MEARALWTVGPGEMALRGGPLPAPALGQLRLRARHSGVSRGTEALVLRGGVPGSLANDMRCPRQEGDFPYPVKYGYALVGVVEDGPADRLGQTCFALHPHQEATILDADAALPLPPGLPPRRAVLGANMETALNIAWDAGVGPGDRVLVVGAGVVGCLTATLVAAIPGTEVTLIDRDPGRASLADTLGLAFAAPDAVSGAMDVAINVSGSDAGLQCAIDAAGPEATVVEASWYGDRPATLSLGTGFHPGRLTIRSSQVGQLPPARRPRWTHTRRLAKALELLADRPRLDALLGPEIPFADAPARLPTLLADGARALCPILTYPD